MTFDFAIVALYPMGRAQRDGRIEPDARTVRFAGAPQSEA